MHPGQFLKAAGDREQMRRFAFLALCLPPAIVLVDQLTWMSPRTWRGNYSREWFHAWLAIKTALITWSTGRILGNTPYGWLLLTWGVALVDLHALVRPDDRNALASTIVSSQGSFLVVWAILSEVPAVWRIAAAMIAATIIIFHASLFDIHAYVEGLPIVQALSVVMLTCLCLALRRAGLRLRKVEPNATGRLARGSGTFRFGVMHMLVWMTALAPLLVVLVGVNWRVYRRLTWPDALPAVLISACIAAISLATIWLVLGARYFLLRLATAAAALFAAEWAMDWLTPPFLGPWPNEIVLRLAIAIDERWQDWFVVLSGLLAAMVLYLRADGYRLMTSSAARADQH